MNAETKTHSTGLVSPTCQNCQKPFTIEPDDFAFYEKLKVPSPTWCPECRQLRRYAWRNERILYRRKCDFCGKSTVTIYSPNKPYKVYCPPCWWSDKWSAFDYGMEFDFSRPFFDQFKELQLEVPRIALLTKNSVNSEYTNHSHDNKDCYLCVSTFHSENILYGHNIWKNAKNCVDCIFLTEGGELLYECLDTERSYRCQYGVLLRDCLDCLYCYDCRNCSNCFLSWNLRNKQYYFNNQPCTKEEYEKKIREFDLGSFAVRQKLYQGLLDMMREEALHRFAVIEKSVNATGNMIYNSKNVQHLFEGDGEDSKYVIVIAGAKNAMDSYHFGFNSELIYEGHALTHGYDIQFSHLSYDNSHLQYCDSCHNNNDLFGCVGVRQSNYAIFNKRYGEKEYLELRGRMIAHMKKTKEYGEFFPPALSPFGYNETTGMTYMPLTEAQVREKNWKWEAEVPGTYGRENISLSSMPYNIRDVKDSVIKDILGCSRSQKNFNVIQQELDFYRQENIPIPRECPNCRHARRVNTRLPRKIFDRQCMCKKDHGQHSGQNCPVRFQTPYAPDRPEKA